METQCPKIGYTTFREAQRILNLARNRRKNHGHHNAKKIPRRSYKCPDCGFWHLTAIKEFYEKEK